MLFDLFIVTVATVCLMLYRNLNFCLKFLMAVAIIAGIGLMDTFEKYKQTEKLTEVDFDSDKAMAAALVFLILFIVEISWNFLVGILTCPYRCCKRVLLLS